MDLDLDDQFYDMAVSNTEKYLLFSPWLQSWETAFSTYLAKHQAALNPQERRAAMILKSHHLMAEILSNVDLSLGELGWDAFKDRFAAIVDLAAAVLEDSDSSRSDSTTATSARRKTTSVYSSNPTATLSFSRGIVDPLYEVCSRCRDPVLRRRALDLLPRHPRQECMWSSWSAGRVGTFLMRLEEQDRTDEILAERRISEAWLGFSEGPSRSSGSVKYKRTVPGAVPRVALNPGLFQDRRTGEFGFTDRGEIGDVLRL